MTRTTVTSLVTLVLVASLIWGVWLLTASVTASEPDGRTWCGGSPVSVLHKGNSDNGGELRRDQAAFDARCAAAAHDKLELSAIAGGLVLASGAPLVLIRRRDPAHGPKTAPTLYSFSR